MSSVPPSTDSASRRRSVHDEESYLLALDKRTGKELWRTPREEKSNWSTKQVSTDSKADYRYPHNEATPN